MANNMLGVINLIQEPDDMEALTMTRCLATVPFGGRYRLIDFVLSSMVNSGIPKVAVFAHAKYRSLMDHLGSGKHWDLHRRENGLFILPPVVDDVSDYRRGDLYHFYRHRDYFHQSSLEYVLVTRSHMVCNVDFSDVLKHHLLKDADITVVCGKQQHNFAGRARKVSVDGDFRVTEIQDLFRWQESDRISMEMYVMKKELLLDIVETALAEGQNHLMRGAIRSRLKALKVYSYAYDGYLGVVNSIPGYFHHSMKLLEPSIRQELFLERGPIYTKSKDEPPTHYREGAKIGQSLIANGCVIEGAVENSILFRGVRVAQGAVIRNSIIMQNCVIGEGSSLEHTILDKDVHIRRHQHLRGVNEIPFIAMKSKII